MLWWYCNFCTNLNALGKQNSHGNVLECYQYCITFRWQFSILIWFFVSYCDTIVCFKIFMQHIWMIFNKNTHIFERSAIEINERKNINNIFIDRISKKFTGTKTDFYGKCWHFFWIWKVYQNSSHNFFMYHPDTFLSVAK